MNETKPQQYPTLDSIIEEHQKQLSEAIRTEVQPFIDSYRKLQNKVSLLEKSKNYYADEADSYFEKYQKTDFWRCLMCILLIISMGANIVLFVLAFGRH
jgi:rubrerythrin